MSENFEIRVISLVNQVDRRDKIFSLFEGQGLSWSFSDAVCGSDIDSYIGIYDKKKRLRSLGYDLRPNEIACFISHRNVWEECVNKNVPFLILEDDIKIRDHVKGFGKLAETINLIVGGLRKEFLFVRLGSTVERRFQPLRKLGINVDLVRYFRDPLGAFAYVLSPSVAYILLKNSEKFSCPVDNYMWRGWEHGACLLDLSPDLFFTSDVDTPSNIGDRSKPEINIFNKIRREYFRALNKRACALYEKKMILELKNDISRILI